MQDRRATRRSVLLGTTATVTALAGCSSGGGDGGGDGEDGGDGGTDGSDGSDADGSDGGAATTAGGTDAGPGTETATPRSTPNDSPDPNCTRLAGTQTSYDASGTPFVFTFDYVDSWTLQDPLSGSGGRLQAVTSPVVTVDGEPESAGVQIRQDYDALTASEVDTEIAEGTSGQYNPFEVVRELPYDGETIRVVGAPDQDLDVYFLWLPYGTGDERLYYPVDITTLSSILRIEDGEQTLLCLDEIRTLTDTVVETIRPNPETTIDEV